MNNLVMSFKPSSTSDLAFPIENFLQNSSVVFYQCSLEKNYPILHISDNVKNIFGYSPADFYKNDSFWMEKIHEDDQPAVTGSFLDILKEQKRTYTYRFRTSNGHYIWLRDESMVYYDTNNTPKAITGTAINITDQKQAEQKVKKLNETLEQRINLRTQNLSEANRKLKKQIQYRNKIEKQVTAQQKRLKLLQAGINNINDMVIISKAPIDNPLNSKIIFTNNSFENFTGYTSAEVMGRMPTFLHREKTQTDKLKILNESIKNNEHIRVEFINYKKDGSPYWVDLEMSPFSAEEEGMQYWVGINRDITKRKQAEMALEESEKKYRAYTELSFDAIFELAPNSTIIDCNARACSLFGYSRQELLGMNAKKLTPKKYKGRLPQQINPSTTTGSNVIQQVYKKKDDSIFTCEVSTKLYQRSGDDHIIAYVRDISEHIAYEKTIKKSLREKSTLLSEVHHRVKNNLAVISGLLELQTFNAENEHVIEELRESQSRIQSIATVHELLYQSKSFSEIGLGLYIDELISFISGTLGSENTNIQIKKNIEAISLTVKQAVPCGLLLNELITNAYKHAFKGMEKGIIYINLCKKDNSIQLEIKDNGINLPEDFDVKRPASLGITLINTLVRQLDGTFSVQKKPEKCFSISFEVED